MIVDMSTKSVTERYHLMAGVVIPRPIAWVVTGDEVINIAPFSYFTPLSSNPPTLLISIGHKENGEPKDTLRNLREKKRCVVCMVEEEFLETMNKTASSLPADVSEADEFNISTKALIEGYPPMVEGVKVAMFCEYLKEVDLEGSQTIPVIVKINYLYVDGEIEALNSVARVGRSYAKLGERVKI